MPELDPIKVKVNFDGHELDEGAVQMELFGSGAERRLAPARTALTKLGDDAEDSGKKVTRSLKEVGDESEKSKFQLLDLGRAGVQPANALVAVGVAAAIALAPLIAYTAGLAAALTMGALVVGGMAILGAGVIALAANFKGWGDASKNVQDAQQKLATAQQAVNDALVPTRLQLIHLKEAHAALSKAQAEAQNPLSNFTTAVQGMGKALGQQAVPAATQLLNWLTTLVPAVQQLGSELIAWFGQRVPASITIGNRIFGDFVEILRAAGERIGPIFDKILADPETIEKAFHTAFGGAVDAVGFLLDRLLDLTKWWDTNGPKFEAVARGTFSVVGGLLIWTAQQVENLANLFNFLEPIAAGLWGGIMEGINAVTPVIQFMAGAFNEVLGPALIFIAQHADSLRPILILLGISFGLTAAFIILLAGTIIGLLAGVVALAAGISFLVTWIKDRLPQAISAVGGWFGNFNGWINGMIGGISRAARALGDLAYQISHLPAVQGIAGFHFAGGGVAPPGATFQVGEAGPEIGYALPGGGVVITPQGPGTGSGGGGGSTTINIIGAGLNEEQVAMAITRRLSRSFAT